MICSVTSGLCRCIQRYPKFGWYQASLEHMFNYFKIMPKPCPKGTELSNVISWLVTIAKRRGIRCFNTAFVSKNSIICQHRPCGRIQVARVMLSSFLPIQRPMGRTQEEPTSDSSLLYSKNK